MFYPILVPLDGSSQAESALEPAVARARAFGGSVAEHIAREAPCPVLIVRAKREETSA